MNRRMLIVDLAALGLLAGCATVEKDAAKLASDIGVSAHEAALLYGIVKGIAGIAEMANPALAPVIIAAFAVLDPIQAKIQAGISTAQDVTAAVAQTASLLVAVAPAIKVVASA